MALIGIDASRATTRAPTGTEWYSYHLLRMLPGLGQDDEFFLYTKKPLPPQLKTLGPHVHERILGWLPGRLWTHTRFAWEMLRRPPDILFVPAHTIPIIHPSPTVTTAHDIGFDRFPELYSPAELFYHRWSMRFAVGHARHIIVPSSFTRQELLDVYGVRPERVSVIYHGFDPQQFRILTDARGLAHVVQKYGIRKPYVLSIGRLEQKKNTLGLVQAFTQLQKRYRGELTLVLAGTPGYQFEKVQEFIAAHHLGDAVRCTGYVPPADLPALLNQAALFAFPSHYEGFGLPILEAQACGVPVVTSTVASMPEVAGAGAVLVDPRNPEEIADGMMRILDDPSFAASLKEAGRRNVTRFTWENCAQETLATLHKTVLGVA